MYPAAKPAQSSQREDNNIDEPSATQPTTSRMHGLYVMHGGACIAIIPPFKKDSYIPSKGHPSGEISSNGRITTTMCSTPPLQCPSHEASGPQHPDILVLGAVRGWGGRAWDAYIQDAGLCKRNNLLSYNSNEGKIPRYLLL